MLNIRTTTEQKIYFLAAKAPHGVIGYETIQSWGLTGKEALRVAVHNLCRKGWFARLKRGLYAVQDPAGGGLDDPFYVSNHLFQGYMAFATALNFHNLLEDVPATIFVATRKTSGSRRIGAEEFRAVSIGRRFGGYSRYGDYIVSTRAKTIYDCLHLPHYAGGYPAILKSLRVAKMKENEWRELVDYAKRFETPAFCQRLGYFLDVLAKTGLRIPPYVSSFLEKNSGQKPVRADPSSRAHGKYVRKWRIVDNIGKEKLLHWWYHGRP